MARKRRGMRIMPDNTGIFGREVLQGEMDRWNVLVANTLLIRRYRIPGEISGKQESADRLLRRYKRRRNHHELLDQAANLYQVACVLLTKNLVRSYRDRVETSRRLLEELCAGTVCFEKIYACQSVKEMADRMALILSEAYPDFSLAAAVLTEIEGHLEILRTHNLICPCSTGLDSRWTPRMVKSMQSQFA